MKKAAWIRVAITVEGQAEPEDDFSKTAIEAVRRSFKFAPPENSNLKLAITRIYEDSTPPEDQGEPGAAWVPDEDSSAEEASSGAAASTKSNVNTLEAPASAGEKTSAPAATTSPEKKTGAPALVDDSKKTTARRKRTGK